MYQFVLKMWKQGRCDESYVTSQVEANRLTEEEKETILATEQTI